MFNKYDLNGRHRHRCAYCGFEWEHGNCFNDIKAHTCKECGKEQWDKIAVKDWNYYGASQLNCSDGRVKV